MTEFVYALHDFAPEHDDEISFKAGERIEVVEKDDLYSDGWWQVGRFSFRDLGYCIPSFTLLFVLDIGS
jgi:SH3 domain